MYFDKEKFVLANQLLWLVIFLQLFFYCDHCIGLKTVKFNQPNPVHIITVKFQRFGTVLFLLPNLVNIKYVLLLNHYLNVPFSFEAL